MDQNPQDQHSGAGDLDLNSILLPKKEIHSVDSAQRVDAGTLLNQEQTATLHPTPPPPDSIPATVSQPPEHIVRQGVAPLQTLQGDIAGIVKDQGVSIVSIAAAEAQRRGTQPVSQDAQLAEPVGNSIRTVIFSFVGIVFFMGALGLLGYSLIRNSPLPMQQGGIAPYIAVDGTQTVRLPSAVGGDIVMRELTAAKNTVSLSLGLVAQLYIQQAGTTTTVAPTYMDAQALLSLIAPELSQTFVRTIAPVYLLGVHAFGVNQPFLILKVDSYEQGFAGMLMWEPTLKQDLSPLFTYVPPPHATLSPDTTVVIPLPTHTSSSTVATSTATSTTTIATTSAEVVPTQQTGFLDAIVDNHDARILEDQYGTINFLWTFLDQHTVVITTNPDTLREIITRLNSAPIVSQPVAE